MDCAVDASATDQLRIGSVDDSVGRDFGDVSFPRTTMLRRRLENSWMRTPCSPLAYPIIPRMRSVTKRTKIAIIASPFAAIAKWAYRAEPEAAIVVWMNDRRDDDMGQR